MRTFLAAMAAVAMGCGGGNDSGGAEAQSAQAAAPAPAPAGSETGRVHEVRMLLTADGRYVFEPITLAIRPGDRVRWLNVSGGPHNVAFYPDKIPAAAKDLINAAMVDRMGDLVGKLLVQPNEAYEIVFVGAPVGTYDYYCTPHEMLGMKAQLTIQ